MSQEISALRVCRTLFPTLRSR